MKLKSIIFDEKNPNRDRSLKIFEEIQKDLLKEIRGDRTYKMPPNYINWHTLSGIVSVALSSCGSEYAKVDISAFIHSYRTALWFIKDAPIYCLTEQLITAFDRTDALAKPGILAGWLPSLPTFLLAIPKGFIHTPDGGEVDYLTISCSDCEHPEWNSGSWHNIQIKPFSLEHNLYFQICTVDSLETVWTSGTAVKADGSLIYDENESLGKHTISIDDKAFLQRIRNLVINVLLALEFSPDLLMSVTESEIKRKNKGFQPINCTFSNVRYPRWLGKNYQPFSVISADKKTHFSPCTHWRRGHWRMLESGEGKRWRDSKRLWIEPVLVNSP
ncbi:hypothetical protein [Microcoleus sp. POL10_C6]|uniref:hypothetical protein n=1 Tax=unclassified Microcoleus TaxID=2642155 RepID=UPI002FD23148